MCMVLDTGDTVEHKAGKFSFLTELSFQSGTDKQKGGKQIRKF